jgi:hypothetical protein
MSETKSGLRKIRRKVSLDFAKFDWTRHLGQPWDHTLCAMANDLRVYARLAAPKTAA